MPSSFADVGLTQLWRAALAAGGVTSTPNTAQLITASFTPSAILTYSSLTWATTPSPQTLSGWGFNFDPALHQVAGVLTLMWTFPGSLAGTTFFGIGIYDSSSTLLFFAELFPAAFVVPAGGANFGWTFNLLFSDCQNS